MSEPKFKVGDHVKKQGSGDYYVMAIAMYGEYYIQESGFPGIHEVRDNIPGMHLVKEEELEPYYEPYHTLEELKEKTWPYATVGRLKGLIKDLPDETPVYIERIEDFYFDKNGWITYGTGNHDDSEFILAFSSFVRTQSNIPGVFIHAHY
jgi:hypothetical protein